MMRVLVVDDDLGVRTLLVRLLTGEGYDVVAVGTGQEGLNFLQQEIPSLILIDLVLPDVDGVSFVRRLRQELHDLTPPTVLVSGTLEDVDGEDGRLFTEMLAKPFGLADLRGAIRRAARNAPPARKRSGARLRAAVADLDKGRRDVSGDGTTGA